MPDKRPAPIVFKAKHSGWCSCAECDHEQKPVSVDDRRRAEAKRNGL